MNRLIPPVLFVALLIPLVFLWSFHSEDYAMRHDRQMPWHIPLLLGIAILVWARVQFRNSQAEIHTFKTPRALVTGGPFRFSRNPMYLGFLLCLIAAAFLTNLWCALLAPAAFLAAATFWYIPHEERVLRTTFGANYEAYARRVRRWI